MPKVDLRTLLDLVGGLVDGDDPSSASTRFRRYLHAEIERSTDLRDYVETALAEKGDQYNKALQDLINHLGHLLGYEVTYGRYRGVRSEVGFDGLWSSPTGWAIVVETKTTDVYTVKTATLLGYINGLISDGRVTDPTKVLGICVYGRFDAHANQLENAIVAEGRQKQLRVASVEALLHLLELKQEYQLAHETSLALLLPAPVRIDPLINLIADVVAQEKEEAETVYKPSSEGLQSTETAHTADTQSTSKAIVRLSPISEDYTGRSAVAFTFQGKRYPVSTWKGIAVQLFVALCGDSPARFRETVLEIVGRKRPYFTLDQSDLRQAEPIPDTGIYFEANLSANSIAKLCHTVVERLGYSRTVFEIEADQ